MTTIGRAEIGDIAEVLDVLNSAAEQLHARGIDQWPVGFGPERVSPYVAKAEMWLVRDDDGRAVATVRTTPEADSDFWTPAESHELSMYVSKLARRPHAPAGVGTMLLRWVTDRAASLGYSWVRLDAWRTNTDLHRYYLDRGWTHLRTTEVPGRRSGALFQRPAEPDPQAQEAFSPYRSGSWLEPGTRVSVTAGAHQGTGTIIAIYSPWGSTEEVVRPEDGDVPHPGYWVRLDDEDQAVICNRANVTGCS